MKWCVFKRFRTNTKRGRGVALIELAIVLPLLLTLFSGIIEGAGLLRSYFLLSSAAYQGTRRNASNPQIEPGSFVNADQVICLNCQNHVLSQALMRSIINRYQLQTLQNISITTSFFNPLRSTDPIPPRASGLELNVEKAVYTVIEADYSGYFGVVGFRLRIPLWLPYLVR